MTADLLVDLIASARRFVLNNESALCLHHFIRYVHFVSPLWQTMCLPDVEHDCIDSMTRQAGYQIKVKKKPTLIVGLSLSAGCGMRLCGTE
jgi:hypothetical protein